MHYLIGRDLDGDGNYEFVKDLDNMVLTDDSRRALQITDTQLDYIDMEYLNAAGFYALEAKRFNVSILEELLFTTLVRGFRPRVAPPPRRRPRRMPPPPRPRRAPRPRARSFAMDVIDVLTPMHARATRHGPGPKPRTRTERKALPVRASARPARPAPRPKAKPGAGRRGPGGRGPAR